MLIVSQDGKTVVNLGMIEGILIGQDNNIRTYGCWNGSNNEAYYIMASYENEERAKAVLNLLCSAYANDDKVFFMP